MSAGSPDHPSAHADKPALAGSPAQIRLTHQPAQAMHLKPSYETPSPASLSSTLSTASQQLSKTYTTAVHCNIAWTMIMCQSVWSMQAWQCNAWNLLF